MHKNGDRVVGTHWPHMSICHMCSGWSAVMPSCHYEHTRLFHLPAWNRWKTNVCTSSPTSPSPSAPAIRMRSIIELPLPRNASIVFRSSSSPLTGWQAVVNNGYIGYDMIVTMDMLELGKAQSTTLSMTPDDDDWFMIDDELWWFMNSWFMIHDSHDSWFIFMIHQFINEFSEAAELSCCQAVKLSRVTSNVNVNITRPLGRLGTCPLGRLGLLLRAGWAAAASPPWPSGSPLWGASGPNVV